MGKHDPRSIEKLTHLTHSCSGVPCVETVCIVVDVMLTSCERVTEIVLIVLEV